MKVKCAMMQCDLEEDYPPLGIIMRENEDEEVREQAKKLIEGHGFKPTDIICPDCFWK